jgi:hypothetical protein
MKANATLFLLLVDETEMTIGRSSIMGRKLCLPVKVNVAMFLERVYGA